MCWSWGVGLWGFVVWKLLAPFGTFHYTGSIEFYVCLVSVCLFVWAYDGSPGDTQQSAHSSPLGCVLWCLRRLSPLLLSITSGDVMLASDPCMAQLLLWDLSPFPPSSRSLAFPILSPRRSPAWPLQHLRGDRRLPFPLSLWGKCPSRNFKQRSFLCLRDI